MKNKRGQAAMEFLMTYGWAILAAVIAIGVLASMGVFSPGKFASKACILNAPFGCEESAIGTNIQLNIRNGGGQDYTINGIDITDCTSHTTPISVADGNSTGAITISCGFTSGAKINSDIEISYIKADGTINQTATGTISGVAA